MSFSGQVVSHFRIFERIGSGGMAEVYKAEDLKLHRSVALKFLPAGRSQDNTARTQLLQEARAASKLDHANICTIYEVGETDAGDLFIAMAFYEGETVADRIRRGPMPVDEAANIAMRTARGLEAAHRRGIVHCDVKPANIMLPTEGELKILDFGIARLASGSGKIGGLAYGTIPYVPPERLLGEEGDHRGDIWSLGIVLHRMLTKTSPFKGKNQTEVAQAIVRMEPQPIDRSEFQIPALLQIRNRALAKDPRDRYASAREMAKDLEALLAAGESPQLSPGMAPAMLTGSGRDLAVMGPSLDSEPTVIVLPLQDLSQERDQEYFCSGVTEELIHLLTDIEGLRVVGRDSAFRAFKAQQGDSTESSSELARQLGVDHILRGSVQKSGKVLRVRVQLQRVADDQYLWTEKYQRELEDLFEIQDDIARQIATALELTLVAKAPEARQVGSVESFEAHNLYLKGRFFWNQRDETSLAQGIEFFNRAIEEEPRFARAHAGLADSWAMLGIYGARPATEVMPKAAQAAQRALDLQPQLAEAYVSRALVRSHYDWDFHGAGQDFEQAIALDSHLASAHQQYAMTCLLPQGRFDEAFEQLRKARELDPLSVPIHTSLGLGFLFARHSQAAVEEFTKVLAADERFIRVRMFLAQAQVTLARWDDALTSIEDAVHRSPETPTLVAALAWVHALRGEVPLARHCLEQLNDLRVHVSPTLAAQVHLGMGDLELAIHNLQRAMRQKSSDLIWLAVHPIYDPLRTEPGFHALLEQLGLPRQLPD